VLLAWVCIGGFIIIVLTIAWVQSPHDERRPKKPKPPRGPERIPSRPD
jgi:hypothetical protein